MQFDFSHTSRLTKFIIIFEFILVAYLVYSLTKNVYYTYQVDKHIALYEEENLKLEAENVQKHEDLLYFTSLEYIDKVAKQNFGLVNPGEEVVILTDAPIAAFDLDDYKSDISDVVVVPEKSNPEKWVDFFFG